MQQMSLRELIEVHQYLKVLPRTEKVKAALEALEEHIFEVIKTLKIGA